MKINKNIFLKIFLLLILAAGWGSSAWAQRIAPTIENAYSKEGHWYYLRFSHHGRYAQANGVGNVITIPNSKATNGSCWWQFVGDNDDFVIVDFSGNYITWANPYKLTSDVNQAAHFVLDPHSGDANAWELKNIRLTGQVWMNPRTSNNNIQHWNDNDNGNKLIFDAVTEQEIWDYNYTGPKWYTMKPNNGGYISSDYATNEGRMHVANSNGKPTTYAGVWRFYDVPGVEGQNLINAKYYTSRVLSVVGTDGAAVSKMDPVEALRASSRYKFEIAPNGFVQVQGENLYLGNNSMQLCVRTTTGDGSLNLNLTRVPNLGNAVTIKCVDGAGDDVTDATIAYSCKREDISTKTVLLNHNDVYDFKDVPYMEYIFTDSPTCKILSTSYDEIHATLTFVVKKVECTEWTFKVTEGYTVNYNGFLDINNGEKVVLPTNIDRMVFSVNNTEDKFVWGPVIDVATKTVTYEVRDLATELTTGWYQLQLAMADNEITAIANKIKHDEGNVNIPAKTLYIAPATLEPGENKHFKITGVPENAGEASTYVHIRNNGGDNYTLTNASTGAVYTGAFTFNGGRLTKSSGWSIEDPVHPLEGPYIMPTGSYAFAFNLAAVDVSQYMVYQIHSNDANVQIIVNNNNILGSKVIKDGGYIFLPKDANAPVKSQFSAHGGNATVTNVIIGNEADGVTPITVTLDTRKTYWRAIITGDAKTDDDRVIYNGINYVHEALMPLPYGTTPSAVDFKTNVTDRFVWGPIIDDKLLTVTFEVVNTVTELTSGKWYQMVLRDKPGQVYNGGVRNVDSMVGAINEMPHLRQRSNYIYPVTANATDWPFELTGTTGEDMRANTFIYVKNVAGNNVTMMMQNGMHLNQNGQGYSAENNTVPLVYQSGTKAFRWNSNALPWENLRNNVGVGNTGAASSGNMEFFMTQAPVKAYKVILSNGIGTLVYNGDAEIIGSRRTENGRFFFAKEGQMLEGEATTIDISKFDLRGVDGTINSITANTTAGITTLTVNVTSRTYNHEIIHKQNRYYDYLETDPVKPEDGFIHDGEGWSTRTGKNGELINEQNTSVFEIPVYLKQGTSITSYLPTNQLASYQRWYNWDTDGQVDRTVLTNTNFGSFIQFTNGYAIFRGAINNDNQAYVPVLTLPFTMEEYNVGLDISRFTDYSQNVAGTNNSAIEPTLGMRIVYQVRDAKQIASAIKTASDGGKFYEVHDISLPNVQYGSRASRLEDRTLSTTLPLNMDLNNYWGFNNGGTGNDNLVQLTQDSQLRVVVEGGNAPIQNVMMIPGSASNASGKISRTGFNTGHFVLFQYPDNGYIEPNSTATVNVYMTSGNVEYKLVQFNLTFISNAHPVVVTELKNSYRHPDALAEEFGAPVTELTFDQAPNWEYSITEAGVTYPDYRYPLDYKGASYAFGARNTNRSWAASRGEYALTSFNASSQQTGTPRIAYYPVTNYLRSMADPSYAMGARAEGAYQLYIDAADQPGKIASIALDDALCAGSRLYCYGYIGCTSGGTGQHPTSVLINVMGVNKDTDEEELIYSYCPGIITLRGYAEDGRTIYSTAMGSSSSYSQRTGSEDRNYWAPWQQIGFSFAINASVAARMKGYSIQILNNAYNSNGGDTMLDDFKIFVKKPGAEVANTTPLCSDQIRHIKVITEYETLLEATGDDSNHDGLMNVGFCFLDKEVYDQALIDYAANIDLPRNDANNTYNKAFGLALMGERTLDKGNKDHAFHNFDIIRDGQVSDIYGEEKVHYYTDIPQYSFKESGDDVVYRDSIRGERYIVFKESVAHGEASELENHKWTAGKSYYLLFSTATISAEHVNNHDLGCTVFNLDDNKCSVLYEFTVAPPVSIKGDVEQITSGDEVQACAGQTATLTVNLNGRTDTKDVIIKNLNYDWWMSAPTHEVYKMHNGVPVRDANGHRIPVDELGQDIALNPDGTPVDPSLVQVKEYNTVPATMQNYMNVTWGTYSADHAHLDKHAGDPIYLSDALLEFRRAYPNATDMTGVVPVHKTGDTVEYDLTQDLIDCVAHFLEPDENGYPPLLLMKKEMNLTLGLDYADDSHVVHFVVIPIAPSIYSIDEDAIYCPDPQELRVTLLNKAPSLLNGFNDMEYPEVMTNVPMRVGLQQLNAVKHTLSGEQKYLTVPLRKAQIAYPLEGKRLIKSDDVTLYLVGTDDPAYKAISNTTQDSQIGTFEPTDDEIEEMFINAGEIVQLAVEVGQANPSMKIILNPAIHLREGYTYTFKVKYFEVKDDNTRDMACEGSFVFDMKVVPEYQVWTGAAGNTDWTNDANWARTDRSELLADNTSTGAVIEGATSLTDGISYATNAVNTTSNSFVPMYFTNVLLTADNTSAPELYAVTKASRAAHTFLSGLHSSATQGIIYDMQVKPAVDGYDCELFGTHVAKGLSFAPGASLYNAYMLNYSKAWVEYKLDADRWYTVSSPLKDSYSGEWYSPTNGAKQLSPYFYDITYQQGAGSMNLNDRFRPAYYQRSWDKPGNSIVYEKNGTSNDSYVKADWSYVYNDAQVGYSNGGFSVKPDFSFMNTSDIPADGKVIVRMPKADTQYTYYDINGAPGQAQDAELGERLEAYRLISDDLGEDGTHTITLNVANATSDNSYILLSNPFMAPLDMEEFFSANTAVIEPKYWIVADNKQDVSVKTESGWITTSNDGGRFVAPLQGFFVKLKNGNAVNAAYTSDMQKKIQSADQPVLNKPSRAAMDIEKLTITTYCDGEQSTAVVVVDAAASAGFRTDEDCETFIDGNISEHPTVYTVASGQAATVNVLPSIDMLPLGIICDSEKWVEVSFSDMGRQLYLYDAEADASEAIYPDDAILLPSNTSGRYFISVTDISGLKDTDGGENTTSSETYDIIGRQVTSPRKGTVIIKDGRKILVR